MTKQDLGSKEEVDFYNKRSEQTVSRKTPTLRLKLCGAMISELAALGHRAPDILDLGSVGTLSGMLQDAGNVTAVELSPVAVSNAQHMWPRARFVAGSFFDLDLPESHFDVVVSQEVIEHVDDQAGFADLCAHVLRPNGHVILTTPNAKIAKDPEPDGLQPKENLLTRGQLKRLFNNKFKILKCYSMIRSGRRGLYRVVNSAKLNKIPIWRKTMDSLPFGLHLVLVAQLAR